MRSISFRLFSCLVVLLLFLLFILNYYPVVSSRDMVITQKQSKLSSQASILASSLSSLRVLSAEGIHEVLKVLDLDDSTRLVVCRADSDILFDSITQNARDSLPDERGRSDDLNTALLNKTVFRSEFSSQRRAFVCSFAMPVYHSGELTGAVLIYEQDTENASIILELQKRIFALSVHIAAGALIISFIYCSSLFKRLKSMIRSMKIVGGGDYSHRLVVSGRDELSELGNEFNALASQLEINEQSLRRFVADASHELKTPLASIRLLSDSIVQNNAMDRETIREFVSDIGSEAYRLQRTTEDLLDLSRLDNRSLKTESSPVDIKQITLDAVAVLEPLALENQISFSCELEDGCVVMATVDDMYHIVFNILENAIKYNVKGGKVDVTLSRDGKNISFVVADTGIGISEQDRLNIFARFYRVDKARSREAGGSGLGLSIVHDAVVAHEGTVSVGANTPCGSRFTVTFPAPDPDEIGI